MDILIDVISSISITENDLVLVFQANDLVVSVFDEFGFEFLASVIDGYMVFGPFNPNDLYDIIFENMDGLEILWGLFRPMTSGIELIEEGVISELDNNLGTIFNLNSIVSIDEVQDNLKVFHTQYFDLMGREVSNLSSGLFIEVKTTNKGKISNKQFFLK